MTSPSAHETLTSWSFLSYVIPALTPFSLDTLSELRKAHPSPRALLASIEQRESLFFDETVSVLLVLRVPFPATGGEDALTEQLGRTAIALEVSLAASQPASGGPSPPAVDVFFSGQVEKGTEPFLFAEEEYGGDEDDEEEEASSSMDGDGDGKGVVRRWAYASWVVPVFIQRPRLRLQDPHVVFAASATLAPASSDLDTPQQAAAGAPSRRRTYLAPGRPSSLNLLASLAADPTTTAVSPVPPRLSAMRVSRVAPMTQPRDLALPLRSLSQLKLRVYPAVQMRLRFNRPPSPPSSSGRPSIIIAVIEVDLTPHTDCEIVLDSIDLTALGCTVEDLNKDVPGMTLPMICVAHDHIAFMYRLRPAELDPSLQEPVRSLGITLAATARVAPGACAPRLAMKWSAPVDFTAPLNPGFGPAMQPIQRSHRPSQLSISHPHAAARESMSLISPSVTRPDSLPSLEEALAAAAARNAEMAIPDLGITVTFGAPTTPVHLGEVFSWTIHVVNRTSDKSTGNPPPRKLALVPLPWRRRPDLPRGAVPVRSTAPAKRGGGGDDGVQDVATAVQDQTFVYALQQSAQVETTDVLCLSADVRVGPLHPGACQVVELRFLALKEGILGMEAIRVIDLGSQAHVDVRDLPIMVVGGVMG